MKRKLVIGIKQLVEFTCRSGDLVFSGSAGPTASQGQRIHRRIQAAKSEAAVAEMALKTEVRHRDYLIVLSGRADLVYPDSSPPIIEEIKSVCGTPDELSEAQIRLYWAQVKVYGYCFLMDKTLEESPVILKLRLYDVIEDQVYVEQLLCEVLALEDYVQSLLDDYLDWLEIVESVREDTVASSRALKFPFDAYRPGQHQLAKEAYRAIRDRQRLLCEAPTGTGKTVSLVFPAIKAMGERLIDKVLYLTAKSTGRETAAEAVASMRSHGLSVAFLTIQAKHKTCFCRNREVARSEDGLCPYTTGFFDRLPAAREQLMHKRWMDQDALLECASRHQLCPFELSLQMLPWASLVVCDYNYVFDPLVQLSYFMETRDRMVLLGDEAHNLPERARSMYSAAIRKADCDIQQRHFYGNSLIGNRLRRLSSAIELTCRSLDPEGVVEAQAPKPVAEASAELGEAVALTSERETTLDDSFVDWMREVFRYNKIEQLYGEHHKAFLSGSPSNHHVVKLMCLNAHDKLAEIYPLFHSIIFFSATLRPAHYFQSALGLEDDVQRVTMPSPFESRHLGLMTCGYVDMRWKNRDRHIDDIIAIIRTTCEARPGNYLVFFPSYEFMEKVLESYGANYSLRDVLVQERDADDAARRNFLNRFQNTRTHRLGFAILGGYFSEGVDYVGERLIGAIVVGVGLPRVHLERELIRQDFASMGLNGFDYAYRFPGFGRVLQTAGRVIRSEKDIGVVVLVDARFDQALYRRQYPDTWRPRRCWRIEDLRRGLDLFWGQHY